MTTIGIAGRLRTGGRHARAATPNVRSAALSGRIPEAEYGRLMIVPGGDERTYEAGESWLTAVALLGCSYSGLAPLFVALGRPGDA